MEEDPDERRSSVRKLCETNYREGCKAYEPDRSSRPLFVFSPFQRLDSLFREVLFWQNFVENNMFKTLATDAVVDVFDSVPARLARWLVSCSAPSSAAARPPRMTVAAHGKVENGKTLTAHAVLPTSCSSVTSRGPRRSSFYIDCSSSDPADLSANCVRAKTQFQLRNIERRFLAPDEECPLLRYVFMKNERRWFKCCGPITDELEVGGAESSSGKMGFFDEETHFPG